MATLLRIVGYIWLGIVAASVALGAIGILIGDGGLEKFWEVFSPFNLCNWGLIMLISLPALGLLKLADRVDKKPRN